MAAANLAITRGGYNTVLELRLLDTPAICIPAWRGAEDQWARIQAAARDTGRIRLGSLDPGHLAAAMRAVVGEAWWRYQPDNEADEVLPNKLSLTCECLWLCGCGPNESTIQACMKHYSHR